MVSTVSVASESERGGRTLTSTRTPPGACAARGTAAEASEAEGAQFVRGDAVDDGAREDAREEAREVARLAKEEDREVTRERLPRELLRELLPSIFIREIEEESFGARSAGARSAGGGIWEAAVEAAGAAEGWMERSELWFSWLYGPPRSGGFRDAMRPALMLALAGLAGPNEPRRSTVGALSAVSVVDPFVRPRKPQLELRSLGVGRLGDVETVAPAIAARRPKSAKLLKLEHSLSV